MFREMSKQYAAIASLPFFELAVARRRCRFCEIAQPSNF
jgi:hypothetical protein